MYTLTYLYLCTPWQHLTNIKYNFMLYISVTNTIKGYKKQK